MRNLVFSNTILKSRIKQKDLNKIKLCKSKEIDKPKKILFNKL